MNADERFTIQMLRDRIEDYGERCERESYTDTGEVWVLLNDTRRELNAMLVPTPMTQEEESNQ